MSITTILTVLPTLLQLRRHERWTREQLENHQVQALDKLRQYVYQHSPFYQCFHQGLMKQPLSELPTLTKSMVMEHFDDLVTNRDIQLEDVRAHMTGSENQQRYLNRYWITATSGSSGQPGIFLSNRAEWAIVIASFARGQEWGWSQSRFAPSAENGSCIFYIRPAYVLPCWDDGSESLGFDTTLGGCGTSASYCAATERFST